MIWSVYLIATRLNFVKKYANLSNEAIKAFQEFQRDVLEGRFPSKEHSFSISEEELKKLASDWARKEYHDELIFVDIELILE